MIAPAMSTAKRTTASLSDEKNSKIAFCCHEGWSDRFVWAMRRSTSCLRTPPDSNTRWIDRSAGDAKQMRIRRLIYRARDCSIHLQLRPQRPQMLGERGEIEIVMSL